MSSYEELAKIMQDSTQIGDIPMIAQLKLSTLFASARISEEEYIALLRLAIATINSQIPVFEKERNGVPVRWDLADEETKQSWETTVTADRINSMLLPREGTRIDMRKIIFPAKNWEDGFNIILTVGAMSPTPVNNQYIVPARTVLILKIMDVKFKEIP